MRTCLINLFQQFPIYFSKKYEQKTPCETESHKIKQKQHTFLQGQKGFLRSKSNQRSEEAVKPESTMMQEHLKRDVN